MGSFIFVTRILTFTDAGRKLSSIVVIIMGSFGYGSVSASVTVWYPVITFALAYVIKTVVEIAVVIVLSIAIFSAASTGFLTGSFRFGWFTQIVATKVIFGISSEFAIITVLENGVSPVKSLVDVVGSFLRAKISQSFKPLG